jgi:hypothetical protein
MIPVSFSSSGVGRGSLLSSVQFDGTAASRRCSMDTYLGQGNETGLGKSESIVLQAQAINCTELRNVLGKLLCQFSRVLNTIDTTLAAVELDEGSTSSFGDFELVALG